MFVAKWNVNEYWTKSLPAIIQGLLNLNFRSEGFLLYFLNSSKSCIKKIIQFNTGTINTIKPMSVQFSFICMDVVKNSNNNNLSSFYVM